MAKKEKQEKIGLISQIDLKKPSIKVLFGILFFIMVVLSLICILPPLWVMISSTKSSEEFFRMPPTIIPQSFEPHRLVDAWKGNDFGKYYLNTLGVTLGAVTFSVICNGLAGFVISKLKPKGIGFIFTLLMITLMLPNTVSMVPVYKNIINFPIIAGLNGIFDFFNINVKLNANLINTFFPMWMMAGTNAFMIIIYKSFFDGISTSYIEAARLDGCNDLDIFARIILPLSTPVIVTSIILTINGQWSDFFWPYMVLTDPKMYTVIVAVFQLRPWLPVNRLIIVLTFAIVPPIIFFMFFQKYIMQGFSMSGIKG